MELLTEIRNFIKVENPPILSPNSSDQMKVEKEQKVWRHVDWTRLNPPQAAIPRMIPLKSFCLWLIKW